MDLYLCLCFPLTRPCHGSKVCPPHVRVQAPRPGLLKTSGCGHKSPVSWVRVLVEV